MPIIDFIPNIHMFMLNSVVMLKQLVLNCTLLFNPEIRH